MWWDVLHVIREKLAGANRGMFNMLALHSKIALTMTVFLILSGTLLFALFEWSNPLTIGDFTPGQKLLAACFQSVTTRTAGIATISQKGLTVPSVITSMFLMFIGGSSVGTAGGVKVTTVAVVALSVDIIFEVYSALGTVGLSRDYTATIGLAGKIILCICMFLGRIGPITMVIAFTMQDTKTALRLPKGKITVG